MKRHRLRDLMDVLAMVILVLGLAVAVTMLVMFLMSLLRLGSAPHAAVTLGAGLQLLVGAILTGGSIRLLVGIDRRLERLEARGARQ